VSPDLRFDGLFLQPRTLAYDELMSCCRSSATVHRVVRLVDALSAARLRADAEVLLATDGTGRSIGMPVRAGVRDDALIVLFELGHFRLEIPGWIGHDEPFDVVCLRAMTFADFVGCGR
jgi:hypothetical protein